MEQKPKTPPTDNASTPIVEGIDNASLEVESPPDTVTPGGEASFTLNKPYTEKMTDEEKKKSVSINLPTGSFRAAQEVIKEYNSSDILDTEAGVEWGGVLVGGNGKTLLNNGLYAAANKEGSNFNQEIESPNMGLLKATVPSFKTKKGSKYTGKSAEIRMRERLGLGTAFTVPLWHSGFWVTIKTPDESSLLEFYRQVSEDKSVFSRTTYGLVFSNTTTYIDKALANFCVSNIYQTSLILDEDEDILDYIKIQDLHVLFWALACSVWPNGFNYQRACIKNPKECSYILSEKLDLKKLQWTDTRALTPRQIKHMEARGSESMTKESIELYVSDFLNNSDKKVSLNESVSVVFKACTVNDHLITGQKWLSDIEERFAGALLKDEKERATYLFNQAKASSMRQYTHFVKHFITHYDDNDESITDSEEDIEATLNILSESDDYRNKFMGEQAKYIDQITMSLVAIPTYKCPNCNAEQTIDREGRKSFSALIPIEANQVFFTLLVQKLGRVEMR